jgi:hypothetical protein
MIKLRNLADDLEELFQSGNWTAGTNINPTTVPFNGYLIGYQAFVGTAGAGTTPTWDILQNGVSIFGATKNGLTAAVREATYPAVPTSNIIPVSRGDVFTLSTIGTWGTTQSINFVVMLLFRYYKQSPPAVPYAGDFGMLTGDGL